MPAPPHAKTNLEPLNPPHRHPDGGTHGRVHPVSLYDPRQQHYGRVDLSVGGGWSGHPLGSAGGDGGFRLEHAVSRLLLHASCAGAGHLRSTKLGRVGHFPHYVIRGQRTVYKTKETGPGGYPTAERNLNVFWLGHVGSSRIPHERLRFIKPEVDPPRRQ